MPTQKTYGSGAVQSLLARLGISTKTESGQLVIDCPACGKEKHCHVSPDQGLWHCKVCHASGKPYKLVDLCRPDLQDDAVSKKAKKIYDILREHGLAEDEIVPRKKPSLTADDVRKITDAELDQVCAAKKIDKAALRNYRPCVHTKHPWMLLPAFEPGNLKLACGWLRCHLNGDLIPLGKEGKKEKYPLIADGHHGLLGLPWLNETNPDAILFVEGWRSSLAAISKGYFATSSSGGASTWRDEWLPAFAGKTVYIVMDRDAAGQRQEARTAAAIVTVAKAVYIVELPYDMQPDNGKDLYNFIDEGGDLAKLLDETKPYSAAPIATMATVNKQRPQKRLLTSFPWTDAGWGERFAARHGNDFCYNHSKDRMLWWDARRWSESRGVPESRHAFVGLCREFRAEALLPENAESRAAIEKYARQSEGSSAITNGLRESQHQPEMSRYIEDFDRDVWLFNVENGTIDLRTGLLRPHNQADMITQLANVIFDHEAKAPRWEQFLNEIMLGDQVMISYLQRLFGMTLSGCTNAQILPILHGLGGNGKNVFVEAITGLMGEYAGESAPDLIVERKNPEHSTEIADLCGKRLVIASENKAGSSLKVELVKRLTGNKRIKARYLYVDNFEFDRTFTIVLMTNHKPLIPTSTLAEWRRIKLIPFSVTIPDEMRDDKLGDKLASEYSGILNWLIAGCLAWQKAGLQEPAGISNATKEYRLDQSPLDGFFDTCCKLDANAFVPISLLKERYELWTVNNNITRELSAQEFNAAMRAKGCRSDQSWWDGRNQKGWFGLNLVDKLPI